MLMVFKLEDSQGYMCVYIYVSLTQMSFAPSQKKTQTYLQ